MARRRKKGGAKSKMKSIRMRARRGATKMVKKRVGSIRPPGRRP